MNAQTLSIIVAVLAAMAGGGAQLHSFMDVLPNGAVIVNILVGFSGFLGAILSAIVAGMTSQKGQIKAVMAMPGTKSIEVDETQANATMMSMAKDDGLPKINVAK